ncbi:nucleoside triphosphate pyrophosphohydrolase [Candidatus Woesearchaeota archaeon]|nr:nucleoside triphosphate pyrophosphohydrolase [Candidatus Woesearchaeota archaeon]
MKLVRDKIPQIIIDNNKIPISHIAQEKEYWTELKKKLQEEVDEFLEDDNEEELADILEVLYAIFDFKGFSKEKIEEIRENKANKRGKFKKRIILDGIE